MQPVFNDWKGKLKDIDRADKEWLRMGLKAAYQAVEGLMNERKTTAGRRNQVLYAQARFQMALRAMPITGDQERVSRVNL